MAIALDGFKVLRRLGDNPEVFAAVRADVDKAARALVMKCLKAKSSGIDAVRAVRRALGDKQFKLLLEGLQDAEVKSTLTRLDRHHPEMKTQSSQWRRQHLEALTSGEADPATSAAKAASNSRKAAGKIIAPARLQSDVMDLFRARGRAKED